MSFKDKFSNFFMLDDEGMVEEQVGAERPRVVEKPAPVAETPQKSTYQDNKKSGGLSLISAKGNGGQKTRIKLMEPRMYSEVKDIADVILSNQSVILNFRRMDNDQAKKVIDFMMGVTYAVEGDIQRIGDQIFLCTPEGIEVDANELGSLNSNDLK